MHVETISLRQDSASRILERILIHIDKDLHGIDLLLVPVLVCKTDNSMGAHLKQVATKHIHVSSNIETNET